MRRIASSRSSHGSRIPPAPTIGGEGGRIPMDEAEGEWRRARAVARPWRSMRAMSPAALRSVRVSRARAAHRAPVAPGWRTAFRRSGGVDVCGRRRRGATKRRLDEETPARPRGRPYGRTQARRRRRRWASHGPRTPRHAGFLRRDPHALTRRCVPRRRRIVRPIHAAPPRRQPRQRVVAIRASLAIKSPLTSDK
jgi:hypothetical protein